MSRVLKWIALALVVLIVLIGVAALFFGAFRFGVMPMMGRGFRAPFMYGRIGVGFWLLMLARMIVPLLLIALLVLFGVAIGRGLSRPRAVPHAPIDAAGPAAVGEAPTGAVQAPAQMPAATAVCPNCGRQVQADWNNCPYCGANLRNNEPGIPPA